MRNQCRICLRDFDTWQHLENHLRAQKSCIGAWYVCKRCFKSFKTPTLLKVHQSSKIICKKYPMEIFEDEKSTKLTDLIWLLTQVDFENLDPETVRQILEGCHTKDYILTFFKMLTTKNLDAALECCDQAKNVTLLKTLQKVADTNYDRIACDRIRKYLNAKLTSQSLFS